MLHEFVTANREEIISRCRTKVAARSAPPPSKTEIDHGVPMFLDQLVDELRVGLSPNPEISRTAKRHGQDLLNQGYSVSQVVHDYGDVCQTITEMAVGLNAPIGADDFRMLNRCLDDAIASAVTEYGRERDKSGHAAASEEAESLGVVARETRKSIHISESRTIASAVTEYGRERNQSAIDGESARGSERLGFFAHELRNLMNTSIMAFEVLKAGNVGVVGSTGTVLHRSLLASHALITRSLAEVRLTPSIQHRERFAVAAFIDEIASASSLEANGHGIRLTVTPIEPGVEIRADRQVLAAVVGNLLHNAFKFTRPRTTVTLSVDASPERVRIEVRDACGGLASGSVNELFRPFEQRSADRTGVGLGLAFSRWGAEANDGRIYARNLPGDGCVFTVDLPRLPILRLAST